MNAHDLSMKRWLMKPHRENDRFTHLVHMFTFSFRMLHVANVVPPPWKLFFLNPSNSTISFDKYFNSQVLSFPGGISLVLPGSEFSPKPVEIGTERTFRSKILRMLANDDCLALERGCSSMSGW